MSENTSNMITVDSPISIVGLLRNALMAEIGAINGYEDNLAVIKVPQIRNVLLDIVKEEKEHYNAFLNLIRKYDKGQMSAFLDIEKSDSLAKGTVPEQEIQNTELILNQLRDGIKGENGALIIYEQMLAKVKQKDILDVFHKVIEDEKHHAEELNNLLNKY